MPFDSIRRSVVIPQDLSGKRFGRWTVLNLAGRKRYACAGRSCGAVKIFWNCQCDCGKEGVVSGLGLKNGTSRSCGCLRVEIMIQGKHGFASRKKFGGRLHPIHNSWSAMWQRCTNPNSQDYEYYGGQGVTVCPEWKDFTVFARDMAASWKPGLTIDRWPNQKGNYEPGNCRWGTRLQQSRNSSRCHYLEFNGESLIITDWAKKLGWSRLTIHARLKAGWSVKRTLTTPPRKHA